MNVAGLPVVAWKTLLIACLGLGYGAFVPAQAADPTAPKIVNKKKNAAQEQRERAIVRCRENRGVDCETPEGLKEWILQERPITDEERARAAGGRRARSSAGGGTRRARGARVHPQAAPSGCRGAVRRSFRDS